MILPNLAYFRARTTEEALALRADHPRGRFMAGGTDLLPQVRCGRCNPVYQKGSCTPPEAVIDIKGAAELGSIGEREDGSLALGAAVPVAAVAAHPAVRTRYPLLADCCLALGSYPLRNRATVAGNICNASPCADTAAALLALDAEVEARSPAGTRRIPLASYFLGPGQTALSDGELVTSIVLPAATRNAAGHYGRIARRKAVDLSSVAVLVARVEGTRPSHRVALLSVAPTPLRVPQAEQLLDENGPDAAGRAAESAVAAASPIDDVRATAAYRRAMVDVLTRRGIAVLYPQGR